MADEKQESTPAGRSKDEIALEMMKFIAMTTGYGKGNTGPGFNKGPARSSEEYADSLFELYTKCRKAIE